MIEQLQRGVREERASTAWFAREEEEAMARADSGSTASCRRQRRDHEVGIFLNDPGRARSQYYLSTSVSSVVRSGWANGDDDAHHDQLGARDRPQLLHRRAARRHVRLGRRRDDHGRAVLRTARGRRSSDRSPARATSPNGRERAPRAAGMRPASRSSWNRARRDPSRTRARFPTARSGPFSARYSPTVTDTPVTIASSCAQLAGQ